MSKEAVTVGELQQILLNINTALTALADELSQITTALKSFNDNFYPDNPNMTVGHMSEQ
jgi:hypothetical protein